MSTLKARIDQFDMDVKESLKNSEILQTSLNHIFLAIGNAYYQANKLYTQKSNSSSVPLLSATIMNEAAVRIKQSRASFLDSLDQLEILVIRATEVLERRAKQQHPELFRKSSLAALLATSGSDGAEADLLNMGVDASIKFLEPSPESMLLNGEGLLPPVETPIGDFGLMGVTPTSNPAQATNNVPNTVPINDSLQDSLNLPVESTDLANLDEDMLNGGIDFGHFDNLYFEDTNFDFGMMMED